MLNLLCKMFFSISLWLHFSKSKYKRNELLREETRKTHINFYRSTIKGRFTNRFTNRDTKKSVLKKSGINNSLLNTNTNINNNYKLNNTNVSMEMSRPLFK